MPSLTFCTRLTSGQKVVFSQVVNQWLDNCRQKPYFILNRTLHEQGLSSKVWSSNHSFLYVSLGSLHTEATESSGHTCWCCHLGTFEAYCHLHFHYSSVSALQAFPSQTPQFIFFQLLKSKYWFEASIHRLLKFYPWLLRSAKFTCLAFSFQHY